MADFRPFWEMLKKNEGTTYTNDPDDKGGPTKYGVTQEELASWRKHPVTPEDVAALQEPEAEAIARARYWPYDPIINQGVAMRAADLGYNAGVQIGKAALQRAANACGAALKIDGGIGPRTIAAVNAVPAVKIVPALQEEQRAWYWHCVRRDVRRAAAWGWTSEQIARGLKACDTRDIADAQALKGQLVAQKRKLGNIKFIKGWLNRANEVY
jgi:lysozyme family protein